jgi:hypothetical protein
LPCDYFLTKKTEKPSAKLFESKIAHGKTITADTLIQTPARFLPWFDGCRQALINILLFRLEKMPLFLHNKRQSMRQNTDKT